MLPFEHEGAGAGSVASLDGESGNRRERLRPVAGERSVPIAHTSATETNGQFSPDGQWIAYESDESGRFEIYVQPFGHQGTRQRVSLDGGTQARWRSDGTELYFIAPGGLLNAVPLRLSRDEGPSDFGAPVSLFPVRVDAGDPGYPQYIVSRDGQRFLVNTIVDAGPGVISAIFHWTPPR